VAGSPAQFPVALGGGNPDLRPETGRTTTVGLVVQPPFIEGLSLSLDWYRIKVTDYISTPGGAQNIVDRCAQFNDPLTCPLITFGPGQSLSEVRNINVNLQWLRTRGLDIEAAYRVPLANFSSLPGTVNLRLLATRTFETSSNLFGIVTDRAGETGGLGGAPTWLANLYTGYSVGGFTGTLSTRYIHAGLLNALYTGPDQAGYNPAAVNSINNNRVGGAVYFNLNGSFKFGGTGEPEVFVSVNNLLDRSPPSAPQLQYPSNPVYFDLIGTSYRVGLRAKF
jgi:iron complex outermembrane recepter protein